MDARRDRETDSTWRRIPPTFEIRQTWDEVLVWREPKEWTGPHKLLSISNDTRTVQLSHGPVNFRITVVKPYHRDEEPRNPGQLTPPHRHTSPKDKMPSKKKLMDSITNRRMNRRTDPPIYQKKHLSQSHLLRRENAEDQKDPETSRRSRQQTP